jgi:cold shock protein
MPTGTAKYYIVEKGYGFIMPDEGGRDVFVHVAAFQRSGLSALHDGERLSYDVE